MIISTQFHTVLLCIYNTKKYDTKLNRWTGRSDGLGIETQTLNLSSEIRNLNLNDKYLNEICKRFVKQYVCAFVTVYADVTQHHVQKRCFGIGIW